MLVKKELSARFEPHDSGSFDTGYVTGLPCGGWGSWEGICVEEWCCSGYTLTTSYRHRCMLMPLAEIPLKLFLYSGLTTLYVLEATHIHTWHATCCCSWKLNKNPASSLLLLPQLFLLHISHHTQKCKRIDGHPTWAFSPSTDLTARPSTFSYKRFRCCTTHAGAKKSRVCPSPVRTDKRTELTQA